MVTYNIAVTTVYNEVIYDIQCQLFLKYWGLICTTKTKKSTLMLSFFNLYFGWVVYVINYITAYIQCYIILTTRKFIYTSLTNNDYQEICYHYGYLLYFC